MAGDLTVSRIAVLQAARSGQTLAERRAPLDAFEHAVRADERQRVIREVTDWLREGGSALAALADELERGDRG